MNYTTTNALELIQMFEEGSDAQTSLKASYMAAAEDWLLGKIDGDMFESLEDAMYHYVASNIDDNEEEYEKDLKQKRITVESWSGERVMTRKEYIQYWIDMGRPSDLANLAIWEDEKEIMQECEEIEQRLKELTEKLCNKVFDRKAK